MTLDQVARDAVMGALRGARAVAYSSAGVALATVPIEGTFPQEVTGDVVQSGKAVRVVVESASGEPLHAVPAKSALNHTDLERGGRATFTIGLR